jgi:hypothetical protein
MALWVGLPSAAFRDKLTAYLFIRKYIKRVKVAPRVGLEPTT